MSIIFPEVGHDVVVVLGGEFGLDEEVEGFDREDGIRSVKKVLIIYTIALRVTLSSR